MNVKKFKIELNKNNKLKIDIQEYIKFIYYKKYNYKIII